jgi:citrate lyase gamma subunit
VPIAIVPFNRGDAFFTRAQHDRLQELKARQATLTAAETQELDALIEAEFDAAIARQKSIQQVKM